LIPVDTLFEESLRHRLGLIAYSIRVEMHNNASVTTDTPHRFDIGLKRASAAAKKLSDVRTSAHQVLDMRQRSPVRGRESDTI
jgi:hypothetical protein